MSAKEKEIATKIKELMQYCTDNGELCLVATVPDFDVGDAEETVDMKVSTNCGERFDKDCVLLAIAADAIKEHYGLSTKDLLVIISEFKTYSKNVH